MNEKKVRKEVKEKAEAKKIEREQELSWIEVSLEKNSNCSFFYVEYDNENNVKNRIQRLKIRR